MDATEGMEAGRLPNAEHKPRKRFVGTGSRASSSRSSAPRRVAHQVPDDILHDPELNEAIRGQQSSRGTTWKLSADQVFPPTTTSRFTRRSGMSDETPSRRWPCKCLRV